MPRFLEIAGAVLGLLVLAIAAAWGYWFYTPSIEPVPALDGELLDGSLSVGGLERHFRWYRPAKPAASPPLVFVLHGSMGDGRDARRMTYYEFDRLADRHGFLAVYPDGYEQHWNDCRKAATYAANTKNIDDVGFFSKMIDFFVAEQHANPDRVYATGISNGGQLAYRLALELPDRIAAVAPVAASLPDDANFDCVKSGKPVAILILNGTADPMNPYQGGEVALYGIWGSRGTVMSTDATVEYFAHLAGHHDPPHIVQYPDVNTHDHSRAELRTWNDGPGPEVVLLSVEGGGHTFPHPFHRFPRFIGATNADLDAAAEIWRFFTDKRLNASNVARRSE
ncbi:MAG: polyhydroxybutyrate depolymerase [Deltaproteobacteria bacterium]|nr:MAG: polyhydroxybutyrate depolymerase [Deltaproteobacteria bacterium]